MPDPPNLVGIRHKPEDAVAEYEVPGMGVNVGRIPIDSAMRRLRSRDAKLHLCAGTSYAHFLKSFQLH